MSDRTGETYATRCDMRFARTLSIVSSTPDERVNVRAGFVYAWIHICVRTKENGDVDTVAIKENHSTTWDDLYVLVSDACDS